MPEQDRVLPRGFKNVISAGQVTGFQLQIRTAWIESQKGGSGLLCSA